MDNAMTYEKLYSNMVKSFTVEKTDCKLGDYMLMKANAKKNDNTSTSLTAVSACQSVGTSIISFISYVNDKLTVKKAPIRDKTIRKFPLRTTLSALCSAVVVCSLAISCAIFGIRSAGDGVNTVNNEYTEMNDASESTGELSEELSYTK